MNSKASKLFSKLPPPKLKPSEEAHSISSGLALNKKFIIQAPQEEIKED
jgi:hypothetical protein